MTVWMANASRVMETTRWGWFMLQNTRDKVSGYLLLHFDPLGSTYIPPSTLSKNPGLPEE